MSPSSTTLLLGSGSKLARCLGPALSRCFSAQPGAAVAKTEGKSEFMVDVHFTVLLLVMFLMVCEKLFSFFRKVIFCVNVWVSLYVVKCII